MDVKHVPVLIVGAGAAGLATSALLAKHGVGSLLVEKRSEVFIYPKARNLSFRSLEILRGLGLADEVHAIAQGVSAMVSRPTLNSAEEHQAFDVDAIFSPFKDLSPEPGGQYCPQSALEPILLAHIRRGGSQARYNTELGSFVPDENGVTAVVRDRQSGTTETVRADYLVAADGVHSPVRDALGVTTSGCGALPIYVVFVYFRGPWRKFVSKLGDGDGIQVKNPDVEGIFLPVRDDFGMFITTYFPGLGETADQFTAQRCAELLIKGIGEPIDIEVIDVAPWQPYEQVADQFRSGRVFLVGDSAHTMPPFKAGGANTAVQSAHNLAWKLAAVLNGSAGPALLTTYHTERYPVGRFNARQSLTGPSLAFLRLDDNRPQLSAGEEAPMFPLLIGYQYRSAAVVSDDPVPADPHAVSLVEELHGQPGTRVPHAWVVDRGERVCTLDLLGPGFTLFTGDDDAAWSDAAASVSADLCVPIRLQRIGTELDVDGFWSAAAGLAPDEALLVRPDDFVAWRADKLPDSPKNELGRVLCQVLARTA
ncbi:FAD-binding protein [Mycobacterium florentinum]|uniref:FAD-binding protein n=1 Tax=Mycobacterium florentinum TaxID=292462 RepID=A0A1X1U168_MYCFL|nr:FAD-dependent monooxygenase [Mycobacterium florentinum]MCV7412752.1 FAD-dependent monooxygenase [Mycobacterium florentinum]ORV50408.1 FAD-binding protein [Mycobacterium florentinum]BBX76256.1 FAD-binding monooxygenase [Mycobacterium florentinum]